MGTHAMLVHVVTMRPFKRSLFWLPVLLFSLSTLAHAQTDLSGTWVNLNFKEGLERGNGPYAVDYTGLPLNDDARANALSRTESIYSMLEHQCGMWPPHYIMRGPFNLKIWNEVDPISSNTLDWKIGAWQDRGEMTIWMDGRPHPSEFAPHDKEGFTTGTWEGNTLVAYMTHMNAGSIRRNGVPSSDQATMTLRFLRHGELLTLLATIEDPVYLTEPLIVSSFRRAPEDTATTTLFGPTCIPTYEGTTGVGRVPHFLPGQNPSVDELTKIDGIPREAILGGAFTMYPEYRKKLKETFVWPGQCRMNCSPAVGAGGNSGPAIPPPRPPAR
jgi:hypothetical protein